MITSLTNEKVKLAHALQTQAKARRSESRMALEGVRLIRDALAAGQRPDYILYDPESVMPADLGVSERLCIPVTPEVMRNVSLTETPQGAVGVFPIFPPSTPKMLTRVLIFDGIADPGNMGTMLRTAAAAGIDVALLAPGSTDAYNPKALRAGMGAHFRIPVLDASWPQIATVTADLEVRLADMTGGSAYDQVDWARPWALIIGSEAHGASEQAAHLATSRITIPMAARTESLNAAVACGVILFEAAKTKRR
ncbi:MAG TPA: RNA methyltransferase [Candidatus Limnocylindrales bacterium]|nr:RNA methyltransferase [Candidatus Limnocylindrales bacterium]